MSDGKNKYNDAYDEGYNEGKKDDFFQKSIHSSVKGFGTPGSDDKERQSYNAGYEDGSADQEEGGNSNYSGGTSESSDCFITTATLNSIGKTDNCDELNTFRSFRDKWLTRQADGQSLISEYYKIAPSIVAAINSDTNHKIIYHELWKKNIEPCLNLLKQERFEEAKILYCDVVNELKLLFLRSSNVSNS